MRLIDFQDAQDVDDLMIDRYVTDFVDGWRLIDKVPHEDWKHLLTTDEYRVVSVERHGRYFDPHLEVKSSTYIELRGRRPGELKLSTLTDTVQRYITTLLGNEYTVSAAEVTAACFYERHILVVIVEN